MLFEVELTRATMEMPEWVTDIGNYNSMPKPYRKIDIHRFLHMFGIYMPKGVERREVMTDDLSGSVTILWFHNCGMAFVHPSKWDSTPEGIKYDLSECEFFEIGCDHQFRELGVDECKRLSIQHHGSCWHVEKCDKCEYVHSYDSSG